MEAHCVIFPNEIAEWAWQPFGPEQDANCFTALGWHYRGFPVLKVSDRAKEQIQSGDRIPFVYRDTSYIVDNLEIQDSKEKEKEKNNTLSSNGDTQVLLPAFAANSPLQCWRCGGPTETEDRMCWDCQYVCACAADDEWLIAVLAHESLWQDWENAWYEQVYAGMF